MVVAVAMSFQAPMAGLASVVTNAADVRVPHYVRNDKVYGERWGGWARGEFASSQIRRERKFFPQWLACGEAECDRNAIERSGFAVWWRRRCKLQVGPAWMGRPR